MMDSTTAHQQLFYLLDVAGVEYKVFSHREALTWEELQAVQKETGFVGTELKCMVLKAGDRFVVYVTLQGRRINFGVAQVRLGVKARLASTDELRDRFGAKPGCAYPFGFDERYDIYVDPVVYDQEWVLFSPVLPTQTVQARGADLKKVFDALSNAVHEVTDFNK